jgi:hypothetical protein
VVSSRHADCFCFGVMTFRLLPLLVVLASGCGRVDVDTSGLPCPCSDGNECDPVCNLCVPPGTQAGVTCSDCKILFSDFHASWVTPNSIGWEWSVLDPQAQDAFSAYTLTLTAAGKETLVYDSSKNPELGLFSLPNSGADIVHSTITDELDPGVAYTGTLTARDELDCEFSQTSVARGTVEPASNVSIELFGEGPTTGFIAAKDGSIVDTDCQLGTKCLRTPSPACVVPPNESTCSNLLKFSGLDIAITQENLSEGEFPDAYLEVYAKVSAPAPSWYSWVWLRTQNPDQYWEYTGVTLPNDETYGRVQVPLHELRLKGSGEKLTREKLVAGGIREFNLGTLIDPQNAVVMADEAYIRR